MVIGWFGIGLGWVGYWIKNGFYNVAGICFLLLFFCLYNKVTLGFIQIVYFTYLFIEIECLYLLQFSLKLQYLRKTPNAFKKGTLP
jgi:hypothetical protein